VEVSQKPLALTSSYFPRTLRMALLLQGQKRERFRADVGHEICIIKIYEECLAIRCIRPSMSVNVCWFPEEVLNVCG
jgi:hypothetical protein